MAKRGRRPANSCVKDGPISEGLRRAVEASGASGYSLAKDAGISKPQFYRFLKGERDLSQNGLNSLAARLGVRIVPPEDRAMGPTESPDSFVPATTENEVGSSPERIDAYDRLFRMHDKLGSQIDEEFAAFEAHLGGQVAVPNTDEPRVWNRLRGWLRVPNRQEVRNGDGSAGHQFNPSQDAPDSLTKQDLPAEVSPPPTPESLDVLRSRVKLLVQNCVDDVINDLRSSRSEKSAIVRIQSTLSAQGTPVDLEKVETDQPEMTEVDEWTMQMIV